MTDAARTSSKRYSFTWHDFVALDDDDRRELIDGELVEVEVPNKIHEHIVATLIMFLGMWARTGRRGFVLGSGYKVRIDAHRGVMPDVQFFRASNPDAVGHDDGSAEGATTFAPKTFPGLAIPLAELWTLPSAPRKRPRKRG